MQNIGGGDDVEAVEVESLPRQILLDVQRPVVEPRVWLREAPPGMAQEGLRDVREAELDGVRKRLERLEDRRGRAAGARPDLDDADLRRAGPGEPSHGRA